jgi:hypothetical protein
MTASLTISLIIKDFLQLVRAPPTERTQINETTNFLDLLFEEIAETSRKLTPLQIYNQEILQYQNMPRLNGKSDPLQWWKYHQNQLPYLGISFIFQFFKKKFVGTFWDFFLRFYIFISYFSSFSHSCTKILRNSCITGQLRTYFLDYKE